MSRALGAAIITTINTTISATINATISTTINAMISAAIIAVMSLAGCSGGDVGGGFTPVAGAPALMNATHVWAFSPTNVWILDGTATVHRYDGATWSTLATPSAGGLGCIFALDETHVWLCAGAQVLAYDGSTFTASDVLSSSGIDSLTAFWASSPSDLWAVSSSATVAHFTGGAWTQMSAGEPNKSSIWGSSATDVYAFGVFDLSHYDGNSWTPVNVNLGGGGGQVWGTSANDVWAMGGSSEIAHYDGTTWKTIELELVGELSALWGPAANDVWAVGSAGAIAHWDGSSWTQVGHQAIGAPYLRQFLDVHGSSAHDLWIVGHQLGSGGSTALIEHRAN